MMWNHSTTETEGGGGFMDESYSTVANQSERAEVKRSNNVIPMMIGHLTKSSRKSKTAWGTNVSVVCVVAAVKDIQSQTTKIGYELEDETGKVMAFKWLEAESVVPEGIEKGMYVRVHGTLREQGADQVHIFVMKIVPITKYAEVFSHLLEIVTIAMKKNKTNNCLQGGAVEVPTGKNDDDDDICHGLTNEQKVIYKIIKSNETENGIERGDLKSQVPGNLKSKVDGILEFLASEGHIYTTRSDDFFKAT